MIPNIDSIENKEEYNSKNHYEYTELGNAQRLVHLYGDRLRYVVERKAWFIWSGTRWVEDDGQIHTMRLAKMSLNTIMKEVSAASQTHDDYDDTKRKRAWSWFKRSQSARVLRAGIDLAKSEHPISISWDEFNRDPWLFNMANGTMNLRNRAWQPHDPKDLITAISTVHYDPDAQCPLWDRFILQACQGDHELVSYLHRMIGYCLTGDTREQCLFFLVGNGANGKSTFLEVVRRLMGSYARQTDFLSLLVRKRESVRPDIVRLKGARFVTACEVDGDRAFDEVTIKQLTGGDAIAARNLYEGHIEFQSAFKLVIAANQKPRILGTDEGIHRRFRVIPFRATIPSKERDPELKEKLLGELSGIFNRVLAGCYDWKDTGLTSPSIVCDSTEAYRNESDTVGKFVSTCCAIHSDGRILFGEIYDAYCSWCDDEGYFPLSKSKFNVRLEWLGTTDRFQRRRSGGVNAWYGLSLID